MDINILINLEKIYHYLIYFFSSIFLFAIFFKSYITFTPYNEIGLISKGNTAASWLLGGTLLGFAINLGFAMFYSYNIFQFIFYGFISGIIQLISYSALRIIFKNLHIEIRENNNIAIGMLFGAIAICIGILNGASAY